MNFVGMNTIEQNILMSTLNNPIELLNYIGPARNNMAVVEPVFIPVLALPPEPPDMILMPIETHNELNDMDIETAIIIHSTNEINEPMINGHISVETKELQYPEGLNIDWINNKIIFNHTN